MSRFQPLYATVPLAETSDYGVYVVEIQSQHTPDERDYAYGIRNKKSEVVEIRVFTMPAALETLEQLQAALDKVTANDAARN